MNEIELLTLFKPPLRILNYPSWMWLAWILAHLDECKITAYKPEGQK